MGPRSGRDARALSLSGLIRIGLAPIIVALAASCLAPPATVEAPVTTAPAATTAAPTPTPVPTPTPDPHIAELLDFLAARDRALLSGEREPILALLAENAPQALRDRDLALGRIASARRARPPDRKILEYEGGLGTSLGLEIVTVLETDDQGRTRHVRYFLNNAGATRLAEPLLDDLGPLRTRVAEGFEVRYRDIDADQAEAAEGIAARALASLVARLGEDYRPRRPFTITLAPTTIAGLPAPASGFVNGSEITLLSSQSMVVDGGPAGDWSRRVTTHEIAHVLLFARGRGAWVLAEGIPLWLTDDRRQPELDRLVAADALWDLEHLVVGPRDLEEFFAGYAQASSFVRYLATTYGDRAVLAAWEAGRSLRAEEALRAGLGVTATEAHAGWRASLRPRLIRHEDAAPRPAPELGGPSHWHDASRFRA